MHRARSYAHGRLLDIGCGKKPYQPIFSPGISEYIGVDLPRALAATTVVDVYASALRLPFAPETCDTVLCNEVLEHVPEPVQLMIEAARVLKHGGLLILTTPMTWGLHEEPYDYYRYTPYGLKYLAEHAGLQVEKIDPTSGLWGTVGQRISSHVYHSHGWHAFWIVKGIVLVLCAGIQIIFSALDSVYGHTGDTLDYLLIARKS
jgi:SAM-dependent methyltransferase